jgi:hypothetical protein
LLASREEGVGDRWESARQFYRSVYENGGDNRDGNKNGDGREDVGRYKRDVRLYRVHNGVYAGGDESLKCTFVELSKKSENLSFNKDRKTRDLGGGTRLIVDEGIFEETRESWGEYVGV